MTLADITPPRARSQDGFTMIIALGVMFVTSLLLVAAFTAVQGDIHLTHIDTTQKQAYYAALAGVQEYQYLEETNPDYWQTCGTPQGSVPQETNARYEIKLLPANNTTACSTSNPFGTMIESTGSLANTFRIESVGCAGTANLTSCQGHSPSTVSKRSIVATFKVEGFLDYVYFTQYEVEDPSAYRPAPTADCEKYYEEAGVKRSSECKTLIFAPQDSVNGPMHTDDAAHVSCTSELTFGRESHIPPDVVEINGGTWPACGASEPTYYTAPNAKGVKTYSKGIEITPPESDGSLRSYVEPVNDEFTGVTHLELKGTTIAVKNGGKERTIEWPSNGLIYVQNSTSGCTFEYIQDESDTSSEASAEEPCGNVYVNGTYSKSLTIAAENDVIINKDITPTGVTAGNEPTGTTTLGLIATHFVRIYHPCKSGFGGGNETGSLTNPWIYAAILSTSHSFLVDNHSCGSKLGELNIYGAIAQKFRGSVGTTGSNGNGYIKNYIYDERLATDEPPYYLNPLKAGWKVARETAPTGG
ncbi:MAG: hypothetical protein ABSG95_05895 [Solirubrobacteraceae bacterium]|jgi:Tfp pilus assembly protein PilE